MANIPSFNLQIDKTSTVEDLIRQIRHIKEYPYYVMIYDRLIKVVSSEEADMLIQGLEIGSYLSFKPSKYER